MQNILRRFTRGAVGQATFNLFVWPAMMILTAAATGQDRAPRPLDIYVASLIEASKPMEKQQRAHLQSSESQTPLDILVSKDESVHAEYPEAVEGRRFEYLTSPELLARRKATKSDFPVRIVNPAIVEGGRIKVVVSEDLIGIENGRLVFQIEGWGIVFFRFDCGSGEFRVDEVKWGGI